MSLMIVRMVAGSGLGLTTPRVVIGSVRLVAGSKDSEQVPKFVEHR